VNALLAQIAVGLHKHARMRLVRQRKERLAPLLDQLQRFSSLLEPAARRETVFIVAMKSEVPMR